jgi:hypothetical protein
MTNHPRELRTWDHAKHGPVPDEYWEQAAAHAKTMQDHQDGVDRMWALAVSAFLILLAVGTGIAQLLGYGPIQ